MMLGVNDRQNIRERDLQKEAEKEQKEQEGENREGSHRDYSAPT